MNREEAICKLEYSKKAYQMLIDEKVDSGKLVGKDVKGEWEADTTLDEVYKSMIDALEMAIKVLKQEPCEDAISRQSAIFLANDLKQDLPDDAHLADMVMAHNEGVLEYQTQLSLLPPVNPQAKTGHWEWVQYDYNPKLGNWHCSECRSVVIECVDKNDKGGIPLYKHCPQCGAKMREVEE